MSFITTVCGRPSFPPALSGNTCRDQLPVADLCLPEKILETGMEVRNEGEERFFPLPNVKGEKCWT